MKRAAWLLALALVGCNPSAVLPDSPCLATPPPFGDDPDYSTCIADPGPNDAWCPGAGSTTQTFFCTTPAPLPPGYDCTAGTTLDPINDPVPPSILCCPLPSYPMNSDAGPLSDAGPDASCTNAAGLPVPCSDGG